MVLVSRSHGMYSTLLLLLPRGLLLLLLLLILPLPVLGYCYICTWCLYAVSDVLLLSLQYVSVLLITGVLPRRPPIVLYCTGYLVPDKCPKSSRQADDSVTYTYELSGVSVSM